MNAKLIPVLLALLTACGTTGSSNAYYARLEVVAPTPIGSGGPATMAAFGGDLLYSRGDGLYAVGEDAPRLEGVTLLAALPDALVVQVNGELARSTDGHSFETVSAGPLDALTAVGDDLVGGRVSDTATATLLRSSDQGATWNSLGDITLDNMIEGGSEGLILSTAIDGLVWAQLSGDAELGPNWAYEGATYEVRGEAVTRLSQVSGAPALPAGLTPDGKVVVDIHADAYGFELNRPADVLPIAIVDSYQPGMRFEGEQLISYAMPDMPETTPEPRVLGLDGEGHLLTALSGNLTRSEQPLTRANNQRDQVLAGPGCKDRHSFDGSSSSERPDITVSNSTSAPLTVWSIDEQYRWHRHATVSPGATDAVSGFSLVEGTFLMVLAENGDCAYGHFLKEGIGALDVSVE